MTPRIGEGTSYKYDEDDDDSCRNNVEKVYALVEVQLSGGRQRY